MVVRIGVTYTPKEIEVELQDDVDVTGVVKLVEDAMADQGNVLWLTDRRGRRVGVPSARVAYVDIGGPDDRRVGFGAP